MVQLDKILSERSDERTLRALMALPDMEFGSIVEKVLGCLELRTLRSRPRGEYIIADCEHRPDGRKYTVFFSRKDAPVAKNDVLSLISYTEKTGSDNALVFSASGIASEGVVGSDAVLAYVDDIITHASANVERIPRSRADASLARENRVG